MSDALKTYDLDDLEGELEGLDFAGAGMELENEFEALDMVMQRMAAST